ncbi:hypothetical protein YC2023_093719 [Brassica napus]
MTVASSVDSLLEKLKQEELYLPPTRASHLSSSFVSILKIDEVGELFEEVRGTQNKNVILCQYSCDQMGYMKGTLYGRENKKRNNTLYPEFK